MELSLCFLRCNTRYISVATSSSYAAVFVYAELPARHSYCDFVLFRGLPEPKEQM